MAEREAAGIASTIVQVKTRMPVSQGVQRWGLYHIVHINTMTANIFVGQKVGHEYGCR